HFFERAAAIAPVFADAFHSLRGSPHVIDTRNIGLVVGIELEPRPGAPGKRAYDVFLDCFESGVLTRQTGDILAFSPPLIVEESHIHQMVESIAKALQRVS